MSRLHFYGKVVRIDLEAFRFYVKQAPDNRLICCAIRHNFQPGNIEAKEPEFLRSTTPFLGKQVEVQQPTPAGDEHGKFYIVSELRAL